MASDATEGSAREEQKASSNGVSQRPRTTPMQLRPMPVDDRPIEFWPTAAIRTALQTDDIEVWQRIAAAIKRDPFGRTARQVEEVLATAHPHGVSTALTEVLRRTRDQLHANECAEVAKHVRQLLDRSGLSAHEFASRIGVVDDEFGAYLEGGTCPPASMMVRMRRLSERFAKMRAKD